MTGSSYPARAPASRSNARTMTVVVVAAIWLFAALAGVLPTAAGAVPLVPQEQPAAPPAAAPSQVIDDTSEAGSDGRIARRIKGIFAAVPGLRNVDVAVNAGVVSLSGKARSAEDIDRAEQIASRITGVVTVENEIERDVSVGESFESIGSISQRLTEFMQLLPLIGLAALVGFAIAAVGYLIASLTWIWGRLAPNSFLSELIASALRFIFVAGGIIAALQILGAGALLGAVLGGAGIIGIALGFAMRDTIENYVASIMLSLRQPFRANDMVRIEEHEGRVIRLTSRATILMTLDGNHLRIPNSTVFKAVILNFTRNPQRRFDFDLGIDADADPDVARRVGVAALVELDFVLKDPPPAAWLEQVGDSNIVLKFLGWIDQRETDWFKSRSRAIPAVKGALEAAGFALPEPIYRLRFDQNAPLQVRRASAGERPPAKPDAGRTPAAHPEIDAVAPDQIIAEMVERERSHSGEAKRDLLDSSRPVE